MNEAVDDWLTLCMISSSLSVIGGSCISFWDDPIIASIECVNGCTDGNVEGTKFAVNWLWDDSFDSSTGGSSLLEFSWKITKQRTNFSSQFFLVLRAPTLKISHSKCKTLIFLQSAFWKESQNQAHVVN